MRIKMCGMVLALSTIALFSDEAPSVGELLETVKNENSSESSIKAEESDQLNESQTSTPVAAVPIQREPSNPSSDMVSTAKSESSIEAAAPDHLSESASTPAPIATTPCDTPKKAPCETPKPPSCTPTCPPTPCNTPKKPPCETPKPPSCTPACPPTPCDTPKESRCEMNQRIQIGGNYTYAWITPTGNQTTSGNLGGLQGVYEYRPFNSIYAAAAFGWRDGTTQNHTTKRTIQDFNVQERLGYTFSSGKIISRFTLFSGFGMRYLAETVTAGTASVVFDYTEFYVPVGFLFEKEVNTIFSWGVNFEWMPHVLPMVDIQPLSGARWKLAYKLGNFFVEVPFKLSTCSDRFAFIISPFFECWHDGDTTAVTNTGIFLNLPGNRYYFTGVNANLAYSF